MDARFTAVLLATGIATAGLGVCPTAATGQAPEPGETVRERPREAYDGIGLRAGGFLLFPSIESGVRYEDNIYREEAGEDEDFVFFVHPGIRAVSRWSNHEVVLDAGRRGGLLRFARGREFDGLVRDRRRTPRRHP